MKQAKLLYVMNHYSESVSTHFAHVIPLLNELSRQRVDVRLVIEKGDGRPRGLEESVQCVILQPSSGLRRMAALYRELRKGVRDGYRVIFVRIAVWSALAAILASRFTPSRVWFWQSGTTIEFDASQPWGHKKLLWLLRSRIPALLVWRHCDRFVTGPESMVDYYASVGGVDPAKIVCLYNDVDVQTFATGSSRLRGQMRSELGLRADEPIVLFVHNLSPVRRTLDYLPLAVEHAIADGSWRSARLVVAGGGADEVRLREAVSRSRLDRHFMFLGPQANHSLRRLYAAADIFIQPSHAEGFPRVLLEAMASGLPIVTTDAGGSADILGAHQLAYVSDRDDPMAFANSLSFLLRRPEEWSALGERNRSDVERFDTARVATMYREAMFG